MRFLVDECTGPAAVVWLRKRGHDVFSVYEEALEWTTVISSRKHSPRIGY